jgi:hypothetical protein
MDFINIAAKQQPVINRLHDAMERALAYAAAIRDNAKDDQQPIPAELVASFEADYNRLVSILTEAAS